MLADALQHIDQIGIGIDTMLHVFADFSKRTGRSLATNNYEVLTVARLLRARLPMQALQHAFVN